MSKNILIIILFGLLVSCNESDEKKWTLVWEDNFDGDAGQLPNPQYWKFGVGTDWGNRQLEYDTDRSENVSLDGEGNLLIIAREEQYEGQNYTSGRIKIQDLFDFTYGRVEARIKLPWGQGIWPAFWMLGANITDVGWPQCGEIDIMEYRGQEPSRIHGSLHGPGYSGGSPITSKYDLFNARFDTDYYLFAVEWESDEIRYYVNDDHYLTIKNNEPPGEWVFDDPFFIILNVAVGGTFVGNPNENTVFPQTMYVDYVRVYQ